MSPQDFVPWKSYIESSEIYSKSEPIEPLEKLIVFAVEDEWYGIEVAFAREVAIKMPITWLPFVPHHISGFIHLRGEMISAMYLKTILGLQGETHPEDYRFVVIEDEGLSAALVVDGLVEVLDIPKSKIDLSFSSFGDREKWFKAKAQDGSRLIAILDAKKLLENTKVEKAQSHL